MCGVFRLKGEMRTCDAISGISLEIYVGMTDAQVLRTVLEAFR